MNKRIEKLDRIFDIGDKREGLVRLDRNERTIPYPDHVIRDVLDKITPDMVSAYPDQSDLYYKLSLSLNVKEGNLLLTAGADSAIKHIFECFVNEGDIVVKLEPTYAMAGVYAQMFGAETVNVSFDSELNINREEIFKYAEKAAIVYIADPNQPTGTVFDSGFYERLLEIVKNNKGLIVIDQAYHEFAEYFLNPVDFVENDNIVFLRTFSKAYGLAGLRLGYIVSSAKNREILYKVKSLADINIFALKFAEYFLDNPEHVRDYVAEVKEARALAENICRDMGLAFYSGNANFFHIKLNNHLQSGDLGAKMREKGYAIRVNNSKGLPATINQCIRITLGTREQIKNFFAELKGMING